MIDLLILGLGSLTAVVLLGAAMHQADRASRAADLRAEIKRENLRRVARERLR